MPKHTGQINTDLERASLAVLLRFKKKSIETRKQKSIICSGFKALLCVGIKSGRCSKVAVLL